MVGGWKANWLPGAGGRRTSTGDRISSDEGGEGRAEVVAGGEVREMGEVGGGDGRDLDLSVRVRRAGRERSGVRGREGLGFAARGRGERI